MKKHSLKPGWKMVHERLFHRLTAQEQSFLKEDGK
jgi:hypothetical protein